MNILLFGESCTGKSTIATLLKDELEMRTYTGKDYLKLAKNKPEAIKIFEGILNNPEESIVFVATEKEDVELVPDSMLKVLVTASLETKKKRFSKRFKGNLPKPVETMLEKKNGMFDTYESDLTIHENQSTIEIMKLIKEKL